MRAYSATECLVFLFNLHLDRLQSVIYDLVIQSCWFPPVGPRYERARVRGWEISE